MDRAFLEIHRDGRTERVELDVDRVTVGRAATNRAGEPEGHGLAGGEFHADRFTHEPLSFYPTPPAWVFDDLSATLVMHDGPNSVCRVDGALSPATCPPPAPSEGQ